MDAAYAICTTPRTAGNLLDAALRSRGFGNPSEYLSGETVDARCQQWGIGHRDYLPELWRRETVNGIFGVRFHWHQLTESYQAADWPDAFPAGVPVVWALLTRADIEAQARSLLTAARTGDWLSPHRPHADGLDERDVAFWTRRLEVHNQRWRDWLDVNVGDYPHLVAEDVVCEPAAAASAIADSVDVVLRRTGRCVGDGSPSPTPL